MADLLLAAYLLAFIPARSLWRSHNNSPANDRSARYWKTIAEIAMLLKGLVLVSFLGGRSAASLGLDWPLSRTSLWCLAGAVVLLAALWIAGEISSNRLSADKRAELEAKVSENDAMPQTAAEVRLFFVTALFVGAGWELLYRGFLLAVLIPHIGAIAAIAVAALAYGLAHGYTSVQQLVSSIAAALIFTSAYYLTGSLWWLMLIHAGIGMIGALSARKVAGGIRTTASPAP